MVGEAALKTKGSGGPSGVDSNGFRRMMACKSFKKSGTNLCSAIATMMRRLCTEYVDPRSIEAILANRLIPLDKGEGKVRPIGVGKVIRWIEWFSFECRKTKTKVITLANHKNTDNTVNQSKFEVITCSRRKARENACERVMIGFGFTSNWMKKWRESFKPIT